MKARTITLEIIIALLALLWLYAALSKWADASNFYRQVTWNKITGQNGAFLFYALPIAELLTAGMLFISRTRRFALYLSGFMLVIFTAYIIYILYFAPTTPCSCGGVISKMSWGQHLVFNCSYLLLNIIAIVLQRRAYYLNANMA